MYRNESIEFCLKNNGSLFYWLNSNEFESLGNLLSSKYFQIFSGQRKFFGNDTLTFHIGLKQLNGIEQFESNSIALSSNFVNISEDFCTIIHLNSSTTDSIRLSLIDCYQSNVKSYPLCRLDRNHLNEDDRFIYRLDKDDYSPGLTGLIDYCSQWGGDPIYAHNAYEWQLIQGFDFLV